MVVSRATFTLPPVKPTPTPPPAFRPRSPLWRRLREGLLGGALVACGLFTLAVTLTIVVILARESWDFFAHPHPDNQGNLERVTLGSFFGDLSWNPLLGGEKHFGIWPLILGTLKITGIAMAFALPLGLVTAVWLAEYASARTRAILKPVLELLAGIPTVVFGFFALTVITPLLSMDFGAIHPSLAFLTRTDENGNPDPANPLGLGVYNALSAGIAVGILCLPIVTSMAEDAVRAVPKALREGAYGLGASKFETSVRVVTPAALSGIISAFLLAISRAVGETMVVALAAGSRPVEMLDPQGALAWRRIFSVSDDVQAMTGYMVERFKGDAPHGTVEFSSSFAVAATLFVITLALTLAGNAIRKRFRQAYA